MASKNQDARNPEPGAPEDPLLQLGRGLVAQLLAEEPVLPSAGEVGFRAVDPEAETVRLDLADLIRDDNGEVVLFNDSGMRSIGLTADAALVEEGQSGAHRTASGEDVSGFRFMTFADGLTLYYQDGVEIVLQAGA